MIIQEEKLKFCFYGKPHFFVVDEKGLNFINLDDIENVSRNDKEIRFIWKTKNKVQEIKIVFTNKNFYEFVYGLIWTYLHKEK